MKYSAGKFVAAVLVIPLMSTATYAQNTDPSDELMEQLQEMEARHQREMDALRAELEALRQARPADADEVGQRINELEQQLEELSDFTLDLRPGTSNFLVTGYARTTFTNKEGSDSSFDAAFFPIFLWKLSDQIFIASELEVELSSDGETEVALEFLEMDFIVNDYLTLRGGKFLSPLSTFKEQLHPSWINKLPDQPLFASGGTRLIPTSSLGIEARGAFPIGQTTLTYSAWIANGFELEPSGKLSFSNFSDINNNKSIGARIGFFPIPELEVFYAFDFGDVAASGSAGVDALIQDFGLGYVTEQDWLGGRLDIRFEYVFSDVDDTGPFDNEREGGYAQVAYRPTRAGSFLKDLEGVVRYDFIDQPSGAPDPSDEERWTIGLNYWLSPSAVFKLAYQFDDVDDPSGAKSSSDAIMAQFAIGF